MKNLTLIITTSAVFALIAGSVFAWGPPGRGGGMMHDYGNPGMMHDYGNQYCQGYDNQYAYGDLSKEQAGQLSALRQAFIDDTYELRSAQTAKRQQIELLMQTSNPDKAKLTGLYGEMDALEKQLRAKQIDYQLAVKKILPDTSFGWGQRYGRNGMGFGNGRHHGGHNY